MQGQGETLSTPRSYLETEGNGPSAVGDQRTMKKRYDWSGGELHVIRDSETTWCGRDVGDETYGDFETARKEHGHFGNIPQCKKCLTYKHSTDAAKGTTRVSTTGV